MSYRVADCNNPDCGRMRVQEDGVCEKCLWDNDAVPGMYACVSRPTEYDACGPMLKHDEIDEDELLRTHAPTCKCELCGRAFPFGRPDK